MMGLREGDGAACDEARDRIPRLLPWLCWRGGPECARKNVTFDTTG
jgi:hypothetical protein